MEQKSGSKLHGIKHHAGVVKDEATRNYKTDNML